jgi:hypothetical protein
MIGQHIYEPIVNHEAAEITIETMVKATPIDL